MIDLDELERIGQAATPPPWGNLQSVRYKLADAEFCKHARNNWQALIDELRRLRAGDFTAEEIHGFCHKLSDTVPPDEFAEGCAEYQKKLYGTKRIEVRK